MRELFKLETSVVEKELNSDMLTFKTDTLADTSSIGCSHEDQS